MQAEATAAPQKAYVYMVKCKDHTYYTGWTNHLEKRIATHNQGKGAKYTKGRLPVVLVWSTACKNKIAAQKLEYKIKTFSRKEKEQLIKGFKEL